MWLDNASEIDILFYEPYADVIADISIDKSYNPLTIGVFGVWGAGKSTLLNLIQQKISLKAACKSKKTICININAWTFEGYEDAKIALMEALLRELDEKQNFPETMGKKLKNLIKKLDVFKLATKAISVGAPIAASALTGNPFPFILSLNASVEDAGDGIKKVADTLQTIRDDYSNDTANCDDDTSVVNNIRKFREDFSDALSDKEIDNVIVLIDDLDRCQPDRIIETLEAIKLFLSVKKMTFIVAADENVIQYAIHKKYPPLSSYSVNLDKEYIEKIIQLPIYIPELSSRDLENYLMLLVAQHCLDTDTFIKLLADIKDSGIMISEEQIDKAKLIEFMKSYIGDNKKEFEELADIVDGIKGIVSYNLKGNPRQAKRFLNTFITKRRLAELYYGKNSLNSKILAKLLVLQKIDNDLFIQLNEWNKCFTTENDEYRKMKKSILEGSVEEKYAPWNTPVIIRWIDSEPVELENERLDRYFYLTRENLKKAEIDESMLSTAAKEILQRIGIAERGQMNSVVNEMKALPTTDQNDIFKVLLPKIEKGELEIFKIRDLFIEFLSYRDKIISSLEKTLMPVRLGDVAAIKTMRNTETSKIDALLENWLNRKIISEALVKNIKNAKEK